MAGELSDDNQHLTTAFEDVHRLVTTMRMAEVILIERVQTSRKAKIDRIKSQLDAEHCTNMSALLVELEKAKQSFTQKHSFHSIGAFNYGDVTPLVYMTYACPVLIPISGLLKISASRRSIFVYSIPIERSHDSGWTQPSQNFEIRTPSPIASRSKVCRILLKFSWWFTGIFIIGT
jgi:hypothetical protein